MTSQDASLNPSISPAPQEPSRLVKLFASGLYSGYFPIASGTVGSAVGVVLFYILSIDTGTALVAISAIVFYIGIKASTKMELFYGHDPAEVTIDEVVGMWISILFLPKRFVVIVIAFLSFRAMDILKPFPARVFDRKSGGYGIMMDDVVAGIYANIIVRVLLELPIVGKLLS